MNQLALLNDLLEHAAPDCACSECVTVWGPYRIRPGGRPEFVPSGWILHPDGWAPPWGVRADPIARRNARLALAARVELERDLRRIH